MTPDSNVIDEDYVISGVEEKEKRERVGVVEGEEIKVQTANWYSDVLLKRENGHGMNKASGSNSYPEVALAQQQPFDLFLASDSVSQSSR
jgi:hypothetical protein